MTRLVAAALGAAGLIHLIPIIGVFGSKALSRLYGMTVAEPGVELLLRHRAVLFGVLGVGFIAAAVRRDWHSIGLGVAIVSTLSFVVLAQLTSVRTPQIDRVVLVDLVLVVLLVLAAVGHARGSTRG